MRKYRNKNVKSKKSINLFDKFNTSIFSLISFGLILIWILSPLIMVIFMPFIGREACLFSMYLILLTIGFLGIFLSLFYFSKKINDYGWKNILKKYLPVFLFIILLFWCVVTTFTSVDVNTSVFGTTYRKEGLLTYFSYFSIFCLALLLKKDGYKKILFNILLFVQIILSIIALMNNEITFLLTGSLDPYSAIFSQFNHYGYYLMFGILVSLFMFFNTKGKLKVLYVLIYSLLLYTLVINDTFGCILSVSFSLILLFIYFRKHWKKIFLIIIITLALFLGTSREDRNVIRSNFYKMVADTKTTFEAVAEKNEEKNNKMNNKKNNSVNKGQIEKKEEEVEESPEEKYKFFLVGNARFFLWKYGIEFIADKPFLGYGIEALEPYYLSRNMQQDRPHNILIQFALFTGIPGMLLYIVFIFVIFFRAICKLKEFDDLSVEIFIMCICYLISSMVGNSMFYTSPYFMIFLGMLTSKTFSLKKNDV